MEGALSVGVEEREGGVVANVFEISGGGVDGFANERGEHTKSVCG